MLERSSKHNKVSEPSFSTNSDAKMITLESFNHGQKNGLLYINSIVKFCKENIMQLNNINNKGFYIYIFFILEFI